MSRSCRHKRQFIISCDVSLIRAKIEAHCEREGTTFFLLRTSRYVIIAHTLYVLWAFAAVLKFDKRSGRRTHSASCFSDFYCGASPFGLS